MSLISAVFSPGGVCRTLFRNTIAGWVTLFISLLSLSILFLSPLSHFPCPLWSPACLLLVYLQGLEPYSLALFIVCQLQFLPSVCFGIVRFQELGTMKNDNKASCSNRQILDNTYLSFTYFIFTYKPNNF